MVWIKFLLCSAALAYFSYKLCREGIVLSEKTGISHGFIGIFFLAVATSFPEIATAAVSVSFLRTSDWDMGISSDQ